jgi:hypothetical protein
MLVLEKPISSTEAIHYAILYLIMHAVAFGCSPLYLTDVRVLLTACKHMLAQDCLLFQEFEFCRFRDLLFSESSACNIQLINIRQIFIMCLSAVCFVHTSNKFTVGVS